MDFIIKDSEGNEQGPVNQETLIKWTAEGKVRPDTPVRNSLIKAWKAADEFSFLKEVLEKQVLLETNNKKGGLHAKNSSSVIEEMKTAFEYKHLPDPANAKLRVAAFFMDLIPLLFVGAILFFIGYTSILKNTVKSDPAEQAAAVSNSENTSAEEITKLPPKDNLEAEIAPSPSDNLSKGYKPGSKWVDGITRKKYSCFESDEKSAKWVENRKANEIFYFYFTIFLFFALLYYGIMLGTFAQTFGMWFFGIFIARGDKEMSEVLHFRAFLFSVFMFIFGILTPLLAALPGKRTALHDIITGVRVYKIAGKPKA